MKYLPLIFLMLLTGCSSLFVQRTPVELIPSRTNIVQVVTTNVIQREVWTTNQVQIAPQRTNEVGQVLPPVFQLMPVRDLVGVATLQTNLTPIIFPAVWFTNMSLGAGATTAIHTAGELAPVPWGGLVSQGLTALAGIGFTAYNWFGKRKALKAAGEAQSSAETFQDATVAVVKGLEEVRKVALQVPGYTPSIDKNVMNIVQGLQTAAGVKKVVADIVEEHTGSTTA